MNNIILCVMFSRTDLVDNAAGEDRWSLFAVCMEVQGH